MQKIRIGQIGTKHDHARDHMDCVRKFPDIYEVVGVVEEDPRQKSMVRADPSYSDYPFVTEEQLFDMGCDAIMVEGFELDLPHIAKRCVENGIAVHIDKPAGIDLAAFEDALRIAKRKGLAVQLGYMYRQNPAFQDCLQLIKSGRLGEIHSVNAIMNTGHPAEKRRWLEHFDAGSMFFLGCHMIDFVYQIQGFPNRITPFLKSSGFDGNHCIDMATVIFEYDHGTSIIQSNSCEINGFGRRQLVVCGTKGTYELHPIERPIGTRFTELDYAETFQDKHTTRNIAAVPVSCRYDGMMLDFAAYVRGERENPYTYEYELQLQRLILASCGYDVDYRATIEL